MKSDVSSFLEVARSIYIDATAQCTADVSDLRDSMTIEARVEQEGMSFLTITLPRFAGDFETALKDGVVSPSLFLGFRKRGAIPVFLRGMLGKLFDHETGRIYDDQNLPFADDIPTIIAGIRQICLAFKKVEIPCTPEREFKAICNYIATEHTLEVSSLPREDIKRFSLVSSVLWHNLVGAIRVDNNIPRHGPGATSEGASGNQKFAWKYWHERLEPFFPFLGTGLPLGAWDHRDFENVTFLPEDQELPVRVVFVPKTLKSPRVIAIEPCCMQFAQQAVRDLLYEAIESNSLTAGHINFRDQSINQRLAISASKDGQLATIDLSDASDRVPHELALLMFQSNPELQGMIEACRSTKALLPTGEVLSSLRKFASMGSALCFPVEAMYFYTLCVDALLRKRNLPVNYSSVLMVSSDVYVYGDDIIVPSTDADTVLDNLQKYFCKVNRAKTFVTGKFRESCGVDAYDGVDVSPTYVRQLPPKNRQQAKELVSWVATANLFYKRGYWQTASLLFKRVERILGPLPFIQETSPALGRKTFWNARTIQRWNPSLHRFEHAAWVPGPVHRSVELGGFPALALGLSRLRDLNDLSVVRDVKHLERFALHGAVTLKRRWIPSS
jgi:hypothetical protein